MRFINQFTINNELTSTKSSSNINQNPHDLTIEISESRNMYVIIYVRAACKSDQSVYFIPIEYIILTVTSIRS